MKRHNLCKLSRGPLGDATYQISNIKALCSVISDKKLLSLLSISLSNHVTSGWAQFWSHVHNLNKLGRGSLDDATCQTRFFSRFPDISLCKTCDALGRALF